MPRNPEQRRPPPRKKKPPPGRRDRMTAKSLRIVHEDGDLLVVDKPPGLLSATPPNSREPSVFDLLRHRARSVAPPGQVWIIHRLDREVSGLMVFARSERAFNGLKEDFRARRVERRYVALVEGEMPLQDGELPSGTVQSFLREDRLGVVRSVPASRAGPDAPGPDTDEAKLAVTYWKALATGRGRTLVELRMDTGRKHQLRVHLADLGHPVAGDERYGARTDPVGRVALQARELGVRHPATGQTVTFRVPTPARWWAAAGAEPPAEEVAPPAPPRSPPPPPRRPRAVLDTDWNRVATWYDQLIDEQRSDHQETVIVPGALRLLAPARGERILDVGCGQGEFCRRLAALGAEPVGVDAAARLVATARERSGPGLRFEALDARELGRADLGAFDAAACVMALMNMDPLDPVLRGVAARLRPGGRFVAVILHPAFRAPRQTSWGVDTAHRPVRRFRRVDGYLSPGQYEIVMNPGEVAAGKPALTTWTFHRPLQTYMKALADAGFTLTAIEEWPSQREARGSRMAAEENRVRKEIPLFLGFRAVRTNP